MRTRTKVSVAVSTGLALFAMFFGAGNMIFPLQVGVLAGQHVGWALVAFIITGVGFPFLGLFALALYEGDYWNFFSPLGNVLSFIVIAFLIVIIGPAVGVPRTELITYHTLVHVLPHSWHNHLLFDFIYFVLVYLLVCKRSHIVDIIGWFLSPVKITAFMILIVMAIAISSPLIAPTQTAYQTFTSAMKTGYGTMDLLGAIFFCSVAYRNIMTKCHRHGLRDQKLVNRITLYSCCIGASLIAIIYGGLILAAAFHADALASTPTESLIGKIAVLVMGPYGASFVSLCVLFVCLATAAALTEVTVNFLHDTVLRSSVPRQVCLIGTLIVMYFVAIIGFQPIMDVAMPVLTVVYPLLILLCVINIVRKANIKPIL